MDILDNFIENAGKSLKEGYYDVGESLLAEGAKTKRVSLRGVLDKNAFSLICEIKHASPAGEYSFDNIDVEKAAIAFLENGADAISVVVEPKIFKGSLDNVPMAKKAGLPVLFKDFISTEKQIDAAHALGADAVLLVVKVTERTNSDLDSLISYAHEKKLEVLLECYDRAEMKIAMETNADILGINNRDLCTLKVDIGRTSRVLEEFADLGRPLISESGIKTAEDARYVRKAGAKGVLVGTAIWTAPDLRTKIRELKTGGADE